MKRPTVGVVAVAIALAACTTNQGTRGPDRSKADDEADIRRTLADVERRINQDDLSFVDAFTNDARIIAPAAADIVGLDAIRAMYTQALKGAAMEVHFSTEEVEVAGDLAYERGVYSLRVSDRASKRVLQDVKNKHIHVFKRQGDGAWKTWRLMTSSAEPPATKN
jgi:ketosteroid isomerase-like protein